MRKEREDVHIIFFLIACIVLVGGVYFVVTHAKHNTIVAHAATSTNTGKY